MRFREISHSAKYELLINAFGIVDMASLIVRTCNNSPSNEFIRVWVKIQISINWLLFFELLLDFFGSGLIEAYRTKFRTWPETVC